MIEYKEFGAERLEDVLRIYEENGWSAYLNDRSKLERAFKRSLFLLGAFEDGRLAGFVRCVGDAEYILYVQDLIVRPSRRRMGVGRELMRRVSDAFPAVRQFVLITDRDDEVSNAFYRAVGFVSDCCGCPVNAYFRPRRGGE